MNEASGAAKGYDIIGDVHGEAAKLLRLLEMMGYEERDGVWRHPVRQAIFVGDIVDRGAEQIESYTIVRDMVDAGAALAAMGNHELNSIAYDTPDGYGGYCRPHGGHNDTQHAAFLKAVDNKDQKRAEIIEWCRSLPLWLDLDGIRVVHACWDSREMAAIQPMLDPGNRLPRDLVAQASDGVSNSWHEDGTRTDANPLFRAAETLLKGVEVNLPDGISFRDKDGRERSATRIAWWNVDKNATYRSVALLPPSTASQLPDLLLPAGIVEPYANDKPLFIGHYWMTGTPTILTNTIACVDYSACNGGDMVAYRWSGETRLTSDNFVGAR